MNKKEIGIIYHLLGELCEKTLGCRNRSILKQITDYILNCPSTIGSQPTYDEISVSSKIHNKLSNNEMQNEVLLYLDLHEKLKVFVDSNKRCSILTFLLLMAKRQANLLGTKNTSLVRSFNTWEFASKYDENADNNIKRFDFIQQQANKPKAICTMKNSKRSANILNSDKLVNDNDIIENALYIFTGIEGKYLRKDIMNGEFKLNSNAKYLNVIEAGTLLRLSEIGYYHEKLKSFTSEESGRCAIGLMGQGFVSALKKEIMNYYAVIANLQEQYKEHKRGFVKSKCLDYQLDLMKIIGWHRNPLFKMQLLAIIAESCQEKKGGALASTLYDYLISGNPKFKQLVQDILINVCRPLRKMLCKWVLEGEISDPHGEFFIECLSEITPDRLWHDKYRVRFVMLPKFITNEMANKILVTGKSINYLREICQDRTSIFDKAELEQCFELNPEDIFSKVADSKLHQTLEEIYFNTSKRVLDIVSGRYKLLQHLQAIRRYLLLGQGDFIGILMENLKSELDKPAKEICCYDISNIMDLSIRSTNAQYDDPEILNNLDVRLLQSLDGDTGWDILSLYYTVNGPLATMLEPAMNNYQSIFKPLWRMKHMEFLLSSKIWKDQMCTAKPLRSMNQELKPIMYRLHLYTSEVIHFIHQMQYYILFEVIECPWAILMDKIEHATALDDILHAHNEFLDCVKIGAFLDAKSQSLCSSMEEVYLGITRLEIWQEKFLDVCFKELELRNQIQCDLKVKEQLGQYGLTAEKLLQREEETRYFEQKLINCQNALEKIVFDYEVAVRQFLLMLNSNSNHNLQLFGTRLDFNEYYKKRDQRLCVPLTFEHMRMSNVHFNSRNSSMNCSKYGIN